MIQFTCPSCGGLSQTDDENAGGYIHCGHCGSSLLLSSQSERQPTVAAPNEAAVGSGSAILILIAGHVFAGLLATLFLGIVQAFLLMTILGAAETILWLLLGQPDATKAYSAVRQTWHRLQLWSAGELAAAPSNDLVPSTFVVDQRPKYRTRHIEGTTGVLHDGDCTSRL
jgi:hypothetical protein